MPEPRSKLSAPSAGIEALDQRFPEIRDRLVAICRSVGGDAAEDAVQEAYIVARRTIGQLRDAEALDGWLTTIAIRHCIKSPPA